VTCCSPGESGRSSAEPEVRWCRQRTLRSDGFVRWKKSPQKRDVRSRMPMPTLDRSLGNGEAVDRLIELDISTPFCGLSVDPCGKFLSPVSGRPLRQIAYYWASDSYPTIRGKVDASESPQEESAPLRIDGTPWGTPVGRTGAYFFDISSTLLSNTGSPNSPKRSQGGTGWQGSSRASNGTSRA